MRQHLSRQALRGTRTAVFRRRPLLSVLFASLMVIGITMLMAVLPMSVRLMPAAAATNGIDAIAVKVNTDNTIVSASAITVPNTSPVPNYTSGANVPTSGGVVTTADSYEFAFWVSKDVSDTSQLVNTALNDGLGTKRMYVKTVSPSGDNVIVEPSDVLKTDNQSRVSLTAPQTDTGKHLVLVYLQSGQGRLLPYTIDNTITFDSPAYDKVNQKMRLIQDPSDSNFSYQIGTYAVAAGKMAVLTAYDANGNVLATLTSSGSTNANILSSTLIADNSTATFDANGNPTRTTKREILIRINNQVAKLSATTQDFTNVKTVWNVTTPASPAPQGLPKSTIRMPYYDNGYDNTGTTGINDTGLIKQPTGYSYHAEWDTSKSYSVSNPQPVTMYPVKAYGWYDSKYPDGNQYTFTSKQGINRSISITLDNIAPLAEDSSEVLPAMSDSLSTVKINGQVFPLPAPRLCYKPNSTTPDLHYCNTGHSLYRWSYSSNSLPDRETFKQGYNCMRLWILGGTNTNYSGGTGCDTNTYTNLPTKTLLQRQITDGPNAGSIIKVELINARLNGDASYSLEDRTGGADNNGYSSSLLQKWRWRFRYKITITNIFSEIYSSNISYTWNTHNAAVLGNSVGTTSVIDGTGSTGQLYTTTGKQATPTYYQPSITLYGLRDDYATSNANYTICPGSDTDQTGDCSYFYLDRSYSWPATNTTGVPAGFYTINGYTNPQLYYRANAAATTDTQYTQANGRLSTINPVTGKADGALWGLIPSGQKVAYSASEVSAATGSKKCVGLAVAQAANLRTSATLMEVPVHYYDQTQKIDTGNFADRETLNGVSAYSFLDVTDNATLRVASGAPPLPVTNAEGKPRQEFSSWSLQGFKNGNYVGTLQDHIMPGEAVDMSNPRFTDGSPAYSSTTGTPVIDELRLVATTSDPSSSTPNYYSTNRVISDGGTIQSVDTFDFVGLAGLNANVTDAYTSGDGKTVTSNTTSYPLSLARSTLSATLANPTTSTASDGTNTTISQPLLMVYAKPQSVTFQKTVDSAGMDQYVGNVPSADVFGLRLTATQSDTNYTIAGGTTNSDIAPGTYTISEVSQRSSSDGSWANDTVWATTKAGITCVNTADNANPTRNIVSNGTLTIAEGATITCSATNSPAVLGISGLQPNGNPYPSGLSISITPVSTGTIIGNWSITQSLQNKLVTPNATYNFSVTSVPDGYRYVGLLKYTGTDPSNPSSDNAYWTDVADPSTITVAAGSHDVYRVVLAKTDVQLPMTGGTAHDWFIIIGGVVGTLALLGAVGNEILRRRRA